MDKADEEGFDALAIVDQNLRYQQNLLGRRLAIVILRPHTVRLQGLVPLAPLLNQTLNGLEPGAFVVIHPQNGLSG